MGNDNLVEKLKESIKYIETILEYRKCAEYGEIYEQNL